MKNSNSFRSRFYLFIALINLLVVNIGYGQTTVTIGAGAMSGTASNGTTGDSGPMYRSTATSNFVYSRHHYLYTATELATAGVISGTNLTKLAWNKDLAAGSNAPCIFQIWVKNSSSTDVGPAGQNWTTLITGSTLVYNNNALSMASPPQWHEFIFDIPFLYTGGAIEISVNYDISAGTSPWTTAGFSWKRDVINNRTLSYVGSTVPLATLPNLRTVRPQVQITFQATGGCSVPPTPGTATAVPSSGICTGSPIALNLTGNSSGSGQTYQWENSANIGGPYISVGSSSPSPLLNTNAVSTLYYRCAVTCSGNTQYSTPVLITIDPAFPGGTYTINSTLATGGSNFQSFNAAVAALSCGISGPVVFNVVSATGPYNEQVNIPTIAGASATNTITFNGNGNTVTFQPTVSADKHIFRLNGADYVTLNNLYIISTSTTMGIGVQLISAADNNTISNCNINMVAVTSTTQSNSAGIAASGSTTTITTVGNNANNLTISGNTILGGQFLPK